MGLCVRLPGAHTMTYSQSYCRACGCWKEPPLVNSILFIMYYTFFAILRKLSIGVAIIKAYYNSPLYNTNIMDPHNHVLSSGLSHTDSRNNNNNNHPPSAAGHQQQVPLIPWYTWYQAATPPWGRFCYTENNNLIATNESRFFPFSFLSSSHPHMLLLFRAVPLEMTPLLDRTGWWSLCHNNLSLSLAWKCPIHPWPTAWFIFTYVQRRCGWLRDYRVRLTGLPLQPLSQWRPLRGSAGQCWWGGRGRE